MRLSTFFAIVALVAAAFFVYQGWTFDDRAGGQRSYLPFIYFSLAGGAVGLAGAIWRASVGASDAWDIFVSEYCVSDFEPIDATQGDMPLGLLHVGSEIIGKVRSRATTEGLLLQRPNSKAVMLEWNKISAVRWRYVTTYRGRELFDAKLVVPRPRGSNHEVVVPWNPDFRSKAPSHVDIREREG